MSNVTNPNLPPLARIGVIGDIHAETTFLHTALCFLQDQHLQRILCVGDIVDGREDVDICCRLLQQYQALTVLGNHDRWFLENQLRDLPEATLPGQLQPESVNFIAGLPAIQEFKTLYGDLLLCHGLGKNDMARVTPHDYGYAIEVNQELQELIRSQRYKFIINGHTHQRMVRSFAGVTIINVGSLKREHNACFAIADFQERIVQFYDIESETIIRPSERFQL